MGTARAMSSTPNMFFFCFFARCRHMELRCEREQALLNSQLEGMIDHKLQTKPCKQTINRGQPLQIDEIDEIDTL